MANATQGGQPAITHQGAFDQSAAKDVQTALTQGDALLLVGSADALPFPGLIMINSTVVDAITLATPVAGPQPAGDDGKVVDIVDNGGHAHTVTTAANKIINSKHIATFNGTIGSNISLQAFNGLWYVIGTPNGVALT